MTNEIALFKSFGLATPASFSYSQPMNAFVGNGYVSAMGNSYFNAVRFVEGLLIKEEVGEGYYHTFLNGLQIFDIRTHALLAEKNYHKVVYRRSFVKQQATILLEELILKEAKLQHRLLNQQDTNRAIAQIISKAFDKDQVQELTKYAKAIGF